MTDDVAVRDAEPTDLNFILGTALNGIYYGDSRFQHVEKNLFMKHYQVTIKDLIIRSQTKLVVFKDDPDVILSYAIFEPDVLHWIYTKNAWRKMGFAKLITPKFSQYTHFTRASLHLKPKALYNPFLI